MQQTGWLKNYFHAHNYITILGSNLTKITSYRSYRKTITFQVIDEFNYIHIVSNFYVI